MRIRQTLFVVFALALLAQTAALAQVPKIAFVSPASVAVGSSTFTLTVTGGAFVRADPIEGIQGSVVRWRESPNTTPIPLTTQFVSSTQLTATVSSQLLTTPRTVGIDVLDGDTGYASNVEAFAITAAALTIVTPSPLQDGTVGVSYFQIFSAVGGYPSYRWRLDSGELPPGMALSRAGFLTGTPTQPGQYDFTVGVGDAREDYSTKAFRLTISAISGPLQVVTPSPLPNAIIGEQYEIRLIAQGGAPDYLWQFVDGQLPAGLKFYFDGTLTGTPTATGVYSFTVQVSDQLQAVQTKSFILTVTTELAIVTAAGLPEGQVGTAYALALEASGGRPPFIWTLTEGTLPPGLELGIDGAITGIPLTSGSSVFTVTVWDQRQVSASRQFQLNITERVPPLTIATGSPLPNGTVGEFYSQTFSAANGVPPYDWIRVEGSLPPGLTLSREGVLSGTPTTEGSSRFQIRVMDQRENVDSAVFDLTISLPPLVITTDSRLPDAARGEDYSVTLGAAGGVSPYSWSLVSNVLPPGLTLSTGGVLSGVPTQAGGFSLLVSVIDSRQETAQRNFLLTVGDSLRVVTTSPLPQGLLGQPYSQSLEAAGGAPGYTWQVVSGGPPPGLTLGANGVLSGTPLAVGSFSFRAQVRDTQQAASERDFQMSVAGQSLPVVSLEGLPSQSDPAEGQTLRVVLSEPYAVPLTGQATLSFFPDATNPSDDPAVQFVPSGGRTANLAIPAGETTARFGDDAFDVGVQAGSVAGRIVITLALSSGGVDVTPTPVPTTEMLVVRAAPMISQMTLTRTSSGFEARIVGLSSPRDMSQALFRFTQASGANLQTSQATVNLAEAFTAWYQNTESTAYGSTFLYVQPFTIAGDSNAVASVTVTLTNSQGDSASATASF